MAEIDSVLASFRSALAALPTPWLLVYMVVIALLWLLAEAMLTWVGRSLWHAPVPLLPAVSVLSVWLIRVARWGLALWLILLLLMVFARWLEAFAGAPVLQEPLARLAELYRTAYGRLTDALPLAVQRWPGL